MQVPSMTLNRPCPGNSQKKSNLTVFEISNYFIDGIHLLACRVAMKKIDEDVTAVDNTQPHTIAPENNEKF